MSIYDDIVNNFPEEKPEDKKDGEQTKKPDEKKPDTGEQKQTFEYGDEFTKTFGERKKP